MTTGNDSKVLLLGGPDSGKTTFVVQLHGRIKVGAGRLRAAGVPSSLTPIEAGLNRLEQGLKVHHTASRTDVELVLPTRTPDGRDIDVTVPDYAGEDLREVLARRQIPERWRDHARGSDVWLVFVRLSRHPTLPDILTRPIGELAQSPPEELDDADDRLPIDMWIVELLQALLHVRGDASAQRRALPRLSLVLSCWDELDESERSTSPATVAASRLTLVDSFCRNTWCGGSYTVVGLSAQGRALDDETPDEDFLDNGPQQMGWLVMEDGGREDDLTCLIAP